jgi:hypothetical protein
MIGVAWELDHDLQFYVDGVVVATLDAATWWDQTADTAIEVEARGLRVMYDLQISDNATVEELTSLSANVYGTLPSLSANIPYILATACEGTVYGASFWMRALFCSRVLFTDDLRLTRSLTRSLTRRQRSMTVDDHSQCALSLIMNTCHPTHTKVPGQRYCL